MGTNYYLKKDTCPHCLRPREIIHLGKSSAGWKFLFHKTKQVYDYESFCKFIKTGFIYDEYDNSLFDDDLINLIQSKQGEKEHPDCENIGGYDFLDCDFC